MLISNKIHYFRNFLIQYYKFKKITCSFKQKPYLCRNFEERADDKQDT